jgi:type II secretion system protein N
MLRLLRILGVIVLFSAVFWLGLLYSFPGAALSSYLEARLSAETGQSVTLQPASLRWYGLNVPQVRIAGLGGDPRVAVVLKEVRVPLVPRLWRGMPVSAELGSGELSVFLPWGDGQMTFSLQAAQLEALPELQALAGFPLRGLVRAAGQVQRRAGQPPAPRGQLPEGSVAGEITGLTVEGLDVLSQKVPAVKLDVIRFDLTLGQRIELRALTFEGDVRGNIEGQVLPNLRRPNQSRLQLSLTAAFRDSWLQGLGEMRPLAESFLDNGQLRARLDGTVERPQFRTAGRRLP